MWLKLSFGRAKVSNQTKEAVNIELISEIEYLNQAEKNDMIQFIEGYYTSIECGFCIEEKVTQNMSVNFLVKLYR